jgi:hypothetical protein
MSHTDNNNNKQQQQQTTTNNMQWSESSLIVIANGIRMSYTLDETGDTNDIETHTNN